MSLESENAKVRWSSLPQIERLTKELEESEKAKLSLESLNHNANAKVRWSSLDRSVQTLALKHT